MSYVRFATLVLMIFVITACGRRLPDEYFDTTSDFPEASAETVEVEEMAGTEMADAETEETDDSEMADAETEETEETDESETADTETDDAEPVEDEPQFELVEVPLDPIVEDVANADPANGESLIASGVPCTSCHQFNSEASLVGPGLLNIPQKAEDRIEGVVAERYLYESIAHPNEYVVEGYPENVMPQTYVDSFSEQEILDLVAYLMTLGEYPEREPVFIEVAVEPSESSEVDAEETAETEADSTEEVEETSDAEAETEDDSSGSSEETGDAEAETEESEAPEEVEEMSTVELDMSNVPATVDILAERGSPGIGAALFTTEIIEESSCATCHTEASDLPYTSAAYAWAAIQSTELHEELGSQYADAITSAEMAHLVAYLASLNEVETE